MDGMCTAAGDEVAASHWKSFGEQSLRLSLSHKPARSVAILVTSNRQPATHWHPLAPLEPLLADSTSLCTPIIIIESSHLFFPPNTRQID